TNLNVKLAANPENVLSEDIWDLRRLKSDYPKHRAPNEFRVDFTWIVNPVLRQQVKGYFRLRLIPWKARTAVVNLGCLKHFLIHLSPETHVGMLKRQHVEEILPKLVQLSDDAACKTLLATRAMLNYM